MKTQLLSIAFISIAATSMAQCTFDQQYAGLGPGMFPAELEPIATCVGCGGHTRSVSLVTNTFLLVPHPLFPGTNITLYIDATKVLSIEGQPSGTTHGTDLGEGPSNFGIWYNTGNVPNQTAVQGCSYVSGDEAAWNAAIGGGPNSDGVYPLTITVDARIHSSNPDVSGFVPNGTWASDVDASLGGGAIVFDTYQLVVTEEGTVSIEERTANFKAYPNPASETLRFNLGKTEQAMVELFDMHGARVAQANLGNHRSEISLDGIANGLYVYRLSDTNGVVLHTDRVAVMH
jgi:hypothetical protein